MDKKCSPNLTVMDDAAAAYARAQPEGGTWGHVPFSEKKGKEKSIKGRYRKKEETGKNLIIFFKIHNRPKSA